jgi:hypothetical protein
MTRTPDLPPAHPDKEAPDVPGLRTWGGVYRLVLACFAAHVLLLALFTHWFNR